MLSDIKVLDLTRVLAGPLCTMLLGDLGANVIKVERPGTGDESRSWGPPFDNRGESAYYLSINRNKLSVAADLAIQADRDLIVSLLAEADVVVDNFLIGALERLGLDPAAILHEHPRLIWCSVRGFGANSTRPGYDFVAQAECGWLAITGEPEGQPMKIGVALADVVAGKDAAISVIAALYARTRTGQGRRIVISLADSARAALVNVAQNALVSGNDAVRWGNAHPNLVPYQLFLAADRPLVLAVGSDTQWLACARVLGLEDLATDPNLATNPGRLAQRERIVSTLAARIRQARAEEWQARFAAAGVPTGIVKGVLDVVREVDASELTGMPSSVGGRVRFPPPRLDQHGGVIRHSGWRVFTGMSGQSD